MESTELMINDLVKDDHDNIIRVEELLYFGINGEWDGDECYGANAVYELLSPIPLDDRILDLNFIIGRDPLVVFVQMCKKNKVP